MSKLGVLSHPLQVVFHQLLVVVRVHLVHIQVLVRSLHRLEDELIPLLLVQILLHRLLEKQRNRDLLRRVVVRQFHFEVQAFRVKYPLQLILRRLLILKHVFLIIVTTELGIPLRRRNLC